MTIKSQDDLNKPETHSTEVLLEAISKLETTTKELEKVNKQLDVAVNGLEMVRNLWLENNPMYRYIAMCAGRITKVALEKIKELEK